jgi:hypothetical protein
LSLPHIQVEESKRQRQWSKRRPPAARLIQTTWRVKCSERSEGSFWKEFLVPHSSYSTLSLQQINAVRFIYCLKHLVARRYFMTASKPYDIKDVLEQYASGQADLLGCVRTTQSGIDSIAAVLQYNNRELRECKKILSSLTDLLANSLHQSKHYRYDERTRKYALPIRMDKYSDDMLESFKRNSI